MGCGFGDPGSLGGGYLSQLLTAHHRRGNILKWVWKPRSRGEGGFHRRDIKDAKELGETAFPTDSNLQFPNSNLR